MLKTMDRSVIGRNEVCLRFLCSKEKRRRILLIKKEYKHTRASSFFMLLQSCPSLFLITIVLVSRKDNIQSVRTVWTVQLRVQLASVWCCAYLQKRKRFFFLFKLRIDYRYRYLFFCTTFLFFLISKRFSCLLKLTSSFFHNILKLGLFARLMPTFASRVCLLLYNCVSLDPWQLVSF